MNEAQSKEALDILVNLGDILLPCWHSKHEDRLMKVYEHRIDALFLDIKNKESRQNDIGGGVMNASIKVICPECSAGFIPCDKDGNAAYKDKQFAEHMRCPEPFDCVLSGKVYKKPSDVAIEEI